MKARVRGRTGDQECLQAEVLANGHVAYSLAGLANTSAAAYEKTDGPVPLLLIAQSEWRLRLSRSALVQHVLGRAMVAALPCERRSL